MPYNSIFLIFGVVEMGLQCKYLVIVLTMERVVSVDRIAEEEGKRPPGECRKCV